MRKIIAALLMILPVPVLEAQDNIRYSIKGQVLNMTTGNPISGVYVTTESSGSQTDRNGNFSIENLSEGKYSVRTMYYSSYSTDFVDLYLDRDTVLTLYISEEALQLEDVVVTGTRSERRLADVPVQTTVIKNYDMVKSGSTSALEALQDNIPGIVVSPNGMGNNMRIKGLNTRYILFLVDGERMVSEGAGGNINLDQIDVNNIERIEMVNGAASALYGSNAVGAVINIITKEPVHKFEAGADVSYETQNTLRIRADVGSNLKYFKIRAGGFRNTSDGFNIEDGPYASPYEDWGGNIRISATPFKRVDINATGRIFTHETFNLAGSMDTKHGQTYSVTGGLDGGYRSADGRNVLKASYNYTQYMDFDVLEKKGNQLDKQSTATYMSAKVLETFRPSSVFELVSGLEYNHESNYSVKTLGAEPTTKSIDDYNVFAQLEWEAFHNFDVVAGARYTYNSQFRSAFTPKLSLMYEIAGFKFRGGVGTAFRAPSIKELYYDFDHQGMFWVYGNPDLKPEKGLYSSLSAEYDRDILNVSLTGYYNNIGNKITQYEVINSQGGSERYYKNVSSATLRGFDVSFSLKMFRQLVLKGNYSFCDAVDNSTGLQLESNVKHSGTVSLTWNGLIVNSPFSLQVAGRFNSPKLFQSVGEGEDGEEQLELSQSKPYNIWKIVFVKPFRINKHTVELTLKCDNVFNFKDSSFINPGRQFLAGVRYSFK